MISAHRRHGKVTGVYTKVGRVLIAVAAAGALVSACGSPVQAGSAIIVGDTTVPLARVQSQVGTLLGRVPADQLGSPNRADAEAKARTLAAGGPAADALFNDSRVARKGVEVAAAADTQNAGSVVFGTPVGDVVAYQPDPQQATWNVFRVTARRTDARPPGAQPTLSLQQLYLIGQRTLQPLADDLSVRVNP